MFFLRDHVNESGNNGSSYSVFKKNSPDYCMFIFFFLNPLFIQRRILIYKVISIIHLFENIFDIFLLLMHMIYYFLTILVNYL